MSVATRVPRTTHEALTGGLREHIIVEPRFAYDQLRRDVMSDDREAGWDETFALRECSDDGK